MRNIHKLGIRQIDNNNILLFYILFCLCAELEGNKRRILNFKIGKLLGEGSFGQVFRVRDLGAEWGTGQFALKVIHNRRVAADEVAAYERINEADPDDLIPILKMREYFIHDGAHCLLFDLLEGETIWDFSL